MALPNQNIPESEKTKEWIMTCVRSIRQQVDSFNWQRDRDLQCRMLWNAETEDYKYDYLRRYGEYELPAFIRFIPILRPKGERLLGEYTERPFQYTIFALDDSTIETALDVTQRNMIEEFRGKLFDRLGNIVETRNSIEQLLSQQQQQQQAVQQAQQEGTGQLIQPGQGNIQTVIPPQVARQMQIYKQLLGQQEIFTDQEIKKYNKKHSYSNLQMHELLMTGGLEYLRYTQHLEKKFYDGFEAKLITDKALFLVDWDSPYEDPYLENVNSDTFYYAADNEIDFTQEADWQCFDAYMSVGHVINKWRYEISDENRQKLEARRSQYATNYGTYYNGRALNASRGLYTFGPDVMANCRVTRAWYRSPRAVHWKKTPNKYLPGKFHDHIIDETELPPVNERKPDEIYETFYMDDIYEGILVDEDIFIRCRKKPVVLRSKKKWGQVMLPVIGLAYLSKNRRPYSRVWASRDVQNLYNLMHFFTELYLATSGPRGIVMDKAQKPAGMSVKEWMYQKKLGTIWIESMKKGRNFAFNQFKTYDDSPGDALQYIELAKESLDGMAARIWGVTPSRQGEISPQEKVGTMERSIRMSTLTTEPIYWEMEYTKRMALERLINLCRLAWRKGRKGAYVDNELNRRILNIPPGAMLEAEYGLYVRDGGREIKLLDTIRQLSIQQKGAGQMSFSQLISIFSTDSVIKLKGLAEEFDAEAQRISQQMQQAEQEGEIAKAQAEGEIKARLAELEAKLKSELEKSGNMLKETQAKVAEAKIQLDRDKMHLEAQIKQMDANTKQQKVQTDAQVQMANIESERFTEFAYLDEERRQFDIEHGIGEQQKENEKGQKELEKARKGKKESGDNDKGMSSNKNPASDGRTSTKNTSKEKIK